MATARRHVATHLPLGERGCIYCLQTAGPFTSEEHVVPRRLGPRTDDYVLAPGIVCDPCNHFLGQQVDAPFTDRFDMTLTRGLERMRDRKGRLLEHIEGRNATAWLDMSIGDGPPIRIVASNVTPTPDGGLDIEITPQTRDPPDIVARTLRALWKIGIGCICLAHGQTAALDPQWDDLRQLVLGTPFDGYLLQRQFQALVTRQLNVNIKTEHPEHPDAVAFLMGGVGLAAPMTTHTPQQINRRELRDQGWEIRTTKDPVPKTIQLRLEPDANDQDPE
jgi:hypothetical protein